MKVIDIIKHATEFGTLRSRENFFSFVIKCLFYIIPAVILGNYTDIAVKKLKEEKELGDYTINYILLQTLICISTLYVILRFSYRYTSEFQVTLAGGFFGVLYFGIQTNYINMLKEVF